MNSSTIDQAIADWSVEAGMNPRRIQYFRIYHFVNWPEVNNYLQVSRTVALQDRIHKRIVKQFNEEL